MRPPDHERTPEYHHLRRRLPATQNTPAPKRISAFINDAVRARLFPDRRMLDAAYRAAKREGWRGGLARDWRHVDAEDWPE